MALFSQKFYANSNSVLKLRKNSCGQRHFYEAVPEKKVKHVLGLIQSQSIYDSDPLHF